MTMTSTKKLKAGIDGDVLVYRAAFKAQYKKFELVADDGTVLQTANSKKHIEEWAELAPINATIKESLHHLDPKFAIKAFKRMVADIKKNTKATEVCVYLSGDTNFREDCATIAPYKGNRSGLKPAAYEDVREAVISHFPHKISKYCEADDLLSIDLYKAYKKGAVSKNRNDCDFIVCTIDKDLDTVPGWHYNLNSKSIEWIDKLDAALFFYRQMLMGDPVDNIKGIYKIGKVRSFNMLEPAYNNDNLNVSSKISYMESIVAHSYKKAYGDDWFEKFIEVGRLLHMQRYQGELWKPKNKKLF